MPGRGYMLVVWYLTIVCCRNFQWVTRVSAKSKRKRKVAETVVRLPGDKDVVNANKYVTQMLAVSLGIKLCDTGRRILLFTKPTNDNKSFYAICRGIFPIHELCGTMTAIALAKRDLLGVSMPLWQLLAPAVVIHGMANFRGMKVGHEVWWNTDWSDVRLLTFITTAHFQVELVDALVGDAALASERCRRFHTATTSQEGLCQA